MQAGVPPYSDPSRTPPPTPTPARGARVRGGSRLLRMTQDSATDLDTSNPHALFTELIRDDHTICDTCFRRIRELTPAPPDRYFQSETLKEIVTDTAILGTGGEYCYPPPRTDPENDDPIRGRPTYGSMVCKACGHIDKPRDAAFGAGLTETPESDAALTLSALKRGVARCVDRAREEGYPVAEEVAFETATHLKTQPSYSTRDADIVATALTMAIRRGSHAPTAPSSDTERSRTAAE